MSSNMLVATHNVIYKPGFDENSGLYIDMTPYQRYSRNCQVYECRCRAGASFRGNAEFKQHIKSKTHQDFIGNYAKYFKEVDEAQDRIKELRVKSELSERTVNKLEREKREITEMANSQIRAANSQISKLTSEKEEIEIEMVELKKKLTVVGEVLNRKNIELEKDRELKTKILRKHAKMVEILNELSF